MPFKSSFLLIFFIFIPVLFTACSPERTVKEFKTDDSIENALFRYGKKGDAYRFRSPLHFPEDGNGLIITLQEESEGKLILTGEDKDLSSYDFSGVRELGIPLQDITVYGLRFEGNTEKYPLLEDIQVGAPLRGIVFKEKGLYRWAGASLKSNDSFLEIHFSSPWELFSSLLIEYHYDTNEQELPQPVEIIALGLEKEEESRFKYYPRPGPNRIMIPEGVIGFSPSVFKVQTSGRDFDVRSITVEPPISRTDPFPITADMGIVMDYEKRYWRNPDYELFAWDQDPAILIMDTLNYRIQSKFFKRLAFFVEKRGYRGSLLTDSELPGLHGWNAQNYGARDLADFFQQAYNTQFPLSKGEELLKNILLKNGVLVSREEGSVGPGRGGILSISRQSPPVLRTQFINHEGQHGLFYSNRNFRDSCFDLWESFDGETKRFWKTLLSWLSYSPDWEYLMVNEYQAYLLQFPLDITKSYFNSLIGGKILPKTPSVGKFLDKFLREHPDYLINTAKTLASVMYSETGYLPGKLTTIKRQH